MRAKELWRFAPRKQMKTERESARTVLSGRIPAELQAKMVAAFERARAERLADQIPEDQSGWGSDPSTRWNTAAFLVLERERRVVAERLSRHYRRRGDRYRDLILVTRLIEVEHEHLAGHLDGRGDAPSLVNGLPVNGDTPADWARPWGSGPMVEMGNALSFYRDQRDQLASRLSGPSRGIAATAAAGHRDRILNRFEMVKSGQLGEEPLAAPQSERRGTLPWSRRRSVRTAAEAGCACVAIGAGAILGESDGPTSLGSNPAPVVASVPDGLLAEQDQDQQPAGSRGDTSTADPSARGNGADQVPVGSPVPAPAPEPVPEPAPAPPAPAPVAAPAPAPPPPPAPEPDPPNNPNPGSGPVSPLPPPVDSLPPPKSSEGG
jgi:hypothetical protein